MKDVRSVSRLSCQMGMSSCSSTISWKDSPLSIGLPLLLCQKSVDYVPRVYSAALLCAVINARDSFSFLMHLEVG